MAKLPPNPLVSEILRAAHGAKTVEKKVEVLTKNKRDDVKACLIWNFDKAIRSAIPEGDVPYKPNDAPVGVDGGHTRLIHEWRSLYNFVRGGNDRLSQMKRETMLVQMLEALHKDEAEILVLVKDGELQSKYRITRNVVEKAYPEIVWKDR